MRDNFVGQNFVTKPKFRHFCDENPLFAVVQILGFIEIMFLLIILVSFVELTPNLSKILISKMSSYCAIKNCIEKFFGLFQTTCIDKILVKIDASKILR